MTPCRKTLRLKYSRKFGESQLSSAILAREVWSVIRARHIFFVIGHFDLGFADVFWSESAEVKGSVMEINAIILDQSWS